VGPAPPRVALGRRAATYHRWPARPAVPELSMRAATSMATYINRQEEDEREVEDDGIYEIATVSFNPRRLIVLAPF